MKRLFVLGCVAFGITGFFPYAQAGNVIFIHPDGAGISHWQAARFYWVGPDGDLNWDRLDHVAVYRGHLENALTASSNGGATVHAYGVKVPYAGFGTDRTGQRPTAASGKPASILHEAKDRGLPTGLVNSGSIIEPGTAAFAVSVTERSEDSSEIVTQMVYSGTNVILGGGEEWFLPEGTAGRYCESGKRKDGRNLIDEAMAAGYRVVFTLEELRELPADTSKVLGIFSEAHTFNDKKEIILEATREPHYKSGSPTLAEMTSEAIRLLSGRGKDFLLVVEEEGADNFGNSTNALGVLTALKRADEAFAVALDFVEKNPDTLVVTAADSSAGGMDVISYPISGKPGEIMSQNRDISGAEWDRLPKGEPFLSQPDRAGLRIPFVITWATTYDASGGIVVRATGKNADAVRGSLDNTAIYALMRRTLFED